VEDTPKRGPGRPPKQLPEQEAIQNPAKEPVASEPEAALSPRAIEVRQERRRRKMGDIDVMARQKLAIPPDIQADLDRKGLTPRWFINEPGRLKQAYAEDWDRVPDMEPVAAYRGNESEHILMCKRKDWFDDDRRYLADLNQDAQKRATKQRGEAGENDSFADHEGGGQAEQVYGPRHTRNRISLAEARISRGA
jgi:hypothetical protein